MTQEIYMKVVTATLIGLLFQVLIKILLLSQKAKTLSVTFSVKQFFIDDKWALIANVVAAFALVYVVGEWLDLDSRITDKIKSIFIFVGFTGSELLMRLLSVAGKRLNSAMDYKSTEGDIKNNTVGVRTPALLPKEIEKLKNEQGQ